MTTFKGSCHCGQVRFEIEAEIDHVRSCDCSICRKRGALNHRIPKENLRLLTPWEDLVLYQWGSRTARDFFCPTCGILPFRRPSDPTPAEIREGTQPFDGWAVNVRCLEGVDLDAIPVKKIYGSRIQHDG
ncbi:MAG: GFA family protein [Arenicellales bacterium]